MSKSPIRFLTAAVSSIALFTALSGQAHAGYFFSQNTLTVEVPQGYYDFRGLKWVRLPGRDGYAVVNDAGWFGDYKANDGTYTIKFSKRSTANNVIEQLEGRQGLVLPVYKYRSRSSYVASDLISNSPLSWRRSSYGYIGALGGNPDNIDPDKELLIVDSTVVDDPTRTHDTCSNQGTPMGAWTFGKLIENVANQAYSNISGGELARHVFENTDGTAADQVIDQWVTASGGPGQPLDLTIAPLQLNAIVNRIDMRTDSNAGEIRFVFGGHRQSVCNATGGSSSDVDFSVILEFKMPGATFVEKQALAQQWHNLSQYTLGSTQYNEALETLTRSITDAGSNPNQSSNRSYLNTLRINSQLGASTWGLREFRLSESGSEQGYLVPVNVALTPKGQYNNSDELGNFINQNASSIVLATHDVPEYSSVTGLPMQELVSENDTSVAWNGSVNVPVTSPQVRHLFSLNTCSGCHGQETASGFHHIRPNRGFGSQSTLSSFMTGVDVADPYNTNIVRHFDELERRATDLDGLLSGPFAWIYDLFYSQGPLTH